MAHGNEAQLLEARGILGQNPEIKEAREILRRKRGGIAGRSKRLKSIGGDTNSKLFNTLLRLSPLGPGLRFGTAPKVVQDFQSGGHDAVLSGVVNRGFQNFTDVVQGVSRATGIAIAGGAEEVTRRVFPGGRTTSSVSSVGPPGIKAQSVSSTLERPKRILPLLGVEENRRTLWEIVKDVGPGIAKEVGQQTLRSFTDPGRAFAEHPGFTTLDLITAPGLLVSGVKLGAKGVAAAGRKVGATTAAGKVEDVATLIGRSQRGATRRAVETIKEEAVKADELLAAAQGKSPRLRAILEDKAAERLAVQVIQDSDRLAFQEFDRIASEATPLLVAIPDDEINIIRGVAEGVMMPSKPLSEASQRFLKWYGKQTPQRQEDLKSLGIFLPREIEVSRALQPRRIAFGDDVVSPKLTARKISERQKLDKEVARIEKKLDRATSELKDSMTDDIDGVSTFDRMTTAQQSKIIQRVDDIGNELVAARQRTRPVRDPDVFIPRAEQDIRNVSPTDLARRRLAEVERQDAIQQGRITTQAGVELTEGVARDEILKLNTKIAMQMAANQELGTAAIRIIRKAGNVSRARLAKAIDDVGLDMPFYIPALRDPSIDVAGFLGPRFMQALDKITPAFLKTKSRVLPAAEPSSILQSRVPDFLRRSTGRLWMTERMEKDLHKTIIRQLDQIRRFRESELSIQNLKASGLARKIETVHDVNPRTEVLWSPDPYVQYMRIKADYVENFVESLSKSVSIEDNVAEAIKSTFISRAKAGELYAGGGHPQIYAVPKGVEKVFNQRFGKPGDFEKFMRMFWDKPQSYWRFMVLFARPAWLVNNVVGNTNFAMLAGVMPKSYLQALDKRFIARMPDNLVGASFTADQARMIYLGRNEDTTLGKMFQALENNPGARAVDLTVGKVGRLGARLNLMTDEFYRRAAFITFAQRRARALNVKGANGKMLEGLEMMENLDRLGIGGVDEVIRQVNFFFNDFRKLGVMERRWVRRGMPFYAFTKHVYRLASGLPLEHPARAQLVKTLTAIANEAVDERFRDLEIDPTKLEAWRLLQVPIGRTPEGKIRSLSTAGFNPFGSTFFTGAKLLLQPSPESLARSAAGALDPRITAGVELIMGIQQFSGRPLSQPEIVELGGRFWRLKPGIKSFEDFTSLDDIIEVPAPSRSKRRVASELFMPVLRAPQIEIAEELLKGTGTQRFDLPDDQGNFQPRPFRGVEARKIPLRERLLPFIGLPIRDFDKEQLERRPFTEEFVRRFLETLAKREITAKELREENK